MSNDYRFVRAYNKLFAPFPAKYFIEKEVEKARQANAPEDAVYQRGDGGWARINDIASNFQSDIQGMLDRI